MLHDCRAGWLASVLIAAAVVISNPFEPAASMLNEAKKFSGLHEIRNNRTLRAMLGINPARTPWCGYFMGLVARKSGRQPPRNYTFARAWTTFGTSVSVNRAQPGDVVVVRTSRSYHVGVLSNLSKQWVQLVGGNQSGRVQQSQFSRRSIVAVRRSGGANAEISAARVDKKGCDNATRLRPSDRYCVER